MSRKDLQHLDIDLVNQASIDSGEDTPVTHVVRDSFNNSRRPSLRVAAPLTSESEYGELDSPGSPWTPAYVSAPTTTTASSVLSKIPPSPSFPSTPLDGKIYPASPFRPSISGIRLQAPSTPNSTGSKPTAYNPQMLNSPVLKVFNQQPFRFFPSFRKKSKRDLKAESLDVPPSPSQANHKANRLPRNRSFAFSTEIANFNRSMDSSEASFPMQPIYVFHNMNTMQQRLGIPYYSTGPSKGKDGAPGSNILRNYYLVHGQQVRVAGEESSGGNNISPVPLQTPRELFDANHTMTTTTSSSSSTANSNLANSNLTGHNTSSGNINIAAAREKLLLKYNLFAHNIASAGETHLSLLYETCLVQYEDILLTMAEFVAQVRTEDLSTAIEGISMNVSNHPNVVAHNASNEHMKAIFTRMGMSTSSMSLLEDYTSIRVENSLSYNSSSSDDVPQPALLRSNSSHDMSEDEQEVMPGDGLLINVSPFDYDKGSALVVIMRFLDIVSAYSEVQQLQSKENEALVLLARSLEKTMSFVSRHLPAAPLSAGSASSANSVSMPVHHEMNVDLAAASISSVTSDITPPFFIKLDESVLQDMQQTLSRLLREVNGGEEVPLDITMYQLLDKLNNDAYMHILYAIANNIRRLCVLLKCTGKLPQAHVAAKTTVHIFQMLSNAYEEHRADLISAYSLLASILDERGQLEESLKIDYKAMELATLLQASTIRLGFPVSSSNPSTAVCTPLGDVVQKM